MVKRLISDSGHSASFQLQNGWFFGELVTPEGGGSVVYPPLILSSRSRSTISTSHVEMLKANTKQIQSKYKGRVFRFRSPRGWVLRATGLGPPKWHFSGGFQRVLAPTARVLGLGFAPRMPIRGLAQQRLQLFILPRPERPLLFSGPTLLPLALPNDGSQC